MTTYILRRLLMMIPTLLGIMVLNFVIVQAAPGGPVERMVAQLTNMTQGDAAARFSGSGGDFAARPGLEVNNINAVYRGARGLDPEVVAQITKMYGFDKPPIERFRLMMGHYLRFDFGESFFRNERVVDLVLHTLPVT